MLSLYAPYLIFCMHQRLMPKINRHCIIRAPACRRCTSRAPYCRKPGNPLIWKILVVTWLSVRTYFHLYVHPSVRQYLENLENSTITIATSLILGVHVMINRKLSQQAICWPVSHDQIAGSGLELIEVVCLFWGWPLTSFWFSDWIAGSSQVISLREREGVCAKAKFRRELTPGRLLTFLLTYSLYNHLLESPWYIMFVISTILVMLTGYSLLKFHSKTTCWTITCSQLIIFWVCDPRKNNPFFPLWSVIAIKSFTFSLG